MKTWQAILGGGLTAGAVDILAAMTIFHAGPAPVFKAIAAGLIGKAAAHDGGFEAVLIGAVCHFAISLAFAAFFVFVAGRWPILLRRFLVSGAAYGVGVYLVMNYLVVPLSAAHGRAPVSAAMIVENGLAMIVFGLIIALFASRLHGQAVSSPAAAPSPAA